MRFKIALIMGKECLCSVLMYIINTYFYLYFYKFRYLWPSKFVFIIHSKPSSSFDGSRFAFTLILIFFFNLGKNSSQSNLCLRFTRYNVMIKTVSNGETLYTSGAFYLGLFVWCHYVQSCTWFYTSNLSVEILETCLYIVVR